MMEASSKETSPTNGYRVLANGISDVAHIQQTADGGPGDGPFAGVTTDMDLEVTVMTTPGNSGLMTEIGFPEDRCRISPFPCNFTFVPQT